MSPTARRRRAPTAKRAAVEADVLRAVDALLSEGATYTDLDIGRIAARAGISRTAFYFYFRDKHELLMRLTEEVTQRLYEQADRWWSGSGEGPADLATALRNAAGLWREHAAVLNAIIEVSAYDEEVGTFWRAVAGRFIEATTARLKQEWGPGRHDPSAGATAFALTWMTERAYYQGFIDADPRALDEIVDAVVGVWQRAVYGGASTRH